MLPAGRTFPGLRYASFGGELTSPAVLRAARARFPDATLTLGFSSTESVQGGFGTQFLPTADLSTLTEIVVRPNGNVEQLLLLDAADRPVELKPGATGRVAIVTAGSADPYLVAPEGQRTAQDEKDLQAAADTFRPAPNGRRLIVFGDRATYRPGPDGAHGLVVLGREGRRIKQNGVFLDLSALDAALTRALPDVLEDASTLAAGRVLVCLFVCKPGAQDDVTLERLNEALRVDTAVQLGLGVRIEKTPIASSGKKDWTALQARADEAAGEQLGDLPALAEADELARQVSDALADVLEEPRLAGRDAPLARVGVDSISAARLANALRTLDGGERVRVEDVLREDSSVSSIAARMRGDVADADEQISKTFLDAEVERLSANLPVLNMSAGDTNIKIIVLTGATGYLGSFILAELLLAHPEAQVICITRAGGLQRVLAALSRTRVEIPSGRIEANVRHVQGDLAAPQLGLGQADAEAVSQADLIIHNGALVHWTRPYGALRAANVDSLLALLALGRRDPPARLTFVSGGGQTALDSGVEDVFTGINGYTASKYVAEQLCARAGTGVRVVRPGYILGDPVCNGDDFLWRLARTAVELRCVVAPASDAPPMNAASVREVARTVLAAPQALERIWVECSLSQLWAAIRRAGYTLEDVDEATWSARLEADLASRGAAHPLVALAAFARDGGGLRGGLGYPRPADLPRKTLPDAVLDGCVRYLWQAGEMPAPDGSWRAPEDRIGRSGR
jgi:thioester reductase-like protein